MESFRVMKSRKIKALAQKAGSGVPKAYKKKG
jgi:hypothetical protein